MTTAQLARLRVVSLMLLLPGLAGLIVSSMVSVHYLDTMPKWSSPHQLRTVPRNIHGTIVYQTEKEDKTLNWMEYSSVGVFLVGLGLGLIYLEKWSSRQARVLEEDEILTENYG